jgi:PAS domain S-box-containing protein
MSQSDGMEKKEQIDHIYDLIMHLASGNLGYRAEVSERNDELDAITMGINMLAEELQSTTVSQDYLGRIYKGVVDMLIVLNADNTIHQVNATLCKLLNYKEEELIGQPMSIIIYRDEEHFFKKINTELAKKGHAYNIERIFLSKKKKLIPVSISCSLLYNTEGQIDGTLLIAKDISRMKRTQEQLKHKNEELNTFIYRVSHDIKGPLASIIGLLNLAKDEIDDPHSIKHYVNLIEMSAYRLDSIIGDFLEIGKLTQSQIRASNIDFNEFISEILESLKYADDFRNIEFRININQHRTFKSKKVLLKAILQNLIENAIKYSKKGEEDNPYIEINVKDGDHKVIIEISDNGIGIEKNMVEHVFKMFYKGEHANSGSGLGLYIVKTSIDSIKGTITVKSTKNVGSTFTIEIPSKPGK